MGNLWDVTDRDIDKLSVQCMQAVFDAAERSGRDTTLTRKPRAIAPTATTATTATTASAEGVVQENLTLAAALMEARKVCKMGHAVGSAPVMYGLPAATVL